MSLSNVRIARLATVPYFVATQLKGQIEHQARTGADVVVLTSAGPELSRLKWNERLRYVHVEIPRSLHPFKDLVALIKLIKAFRRERFDIVHSTTPKAGFLAAIAGKFSGVRVRLHTFTGQPWATRSGPIVWAARFADKVICSLNTRCYADSASQKDFLVESAIAKPEKIGVIGSGSLAGVDLTRFDRNRFPPEHRGILRAELGIGEQSKLVLFVGRICADKGIAELLEAFQQVIDSGIDSDLVLVGPFDHGTREGSDISPDSVSGRKRVHHVDYSETPERYFAIADLLCLPSYREGFGTVVIEAAAMGVPALGTDIYGLRDAIADGISGVLVSPKNPQALAKAMTTLLGSSATLERLGKAARDRAAALFDARIVNELLTDEYTRLLTKADDR